MKEYRRALEEYGAAITLDPRNGELLRGRAGVHLAMAHHLMARGGDPQGCFVSAVEDLDGALSAGARPSRIHQMRCMMLVRRGQAEPARAAEFFDLAIEAGNEAVRVAPKDELSWIERGHARYQRGLSTGRAGDTDDAIADFTEALALAPEAPDALAYRGSALVMRGIARRKAGGDPTEDYEAAARDCTESIRLDSRREDPWSSRARARGNLASYRQSKGDEAAALSDDAVEDFTEAIRLNPRVAGYWHHRGNVRARRADFLLQRREDPRELLRLAAADYTESLARARSDAVLLDRAKAHSRIGDVSLAKGEDCVEYSRALADYHEVMKRGTAAVEVYTSAGRVAMACAGGRAKRGEDPFPALSAAVSSWNAAIERWPSNGVLIAERGNAWFATAQLKQERGKPAATEYRQAMKDFTEGAKLDPRLKVDEGVRRCREYLEAHPDE